MPALHTTVSTGNASRYLQQLCKHFAHKVPVTYDEREAEVAFPFGECRMWANETDLRIECASDSEETLKRTHFVVHDHLERFAWREKPEIVWQELSRE
ncbi:MAG: 2,4-dihydroxyhept-2-ene-1,7-dioic acid aldolase [Stappia sp.]|jgi:hypothetical protein|uniref:DUF2218 domain-containing protein n=1 Tax=Stappia sp. TaxID=1870903 RepID=UPI000C3E7B4C|nr:DUF2218 domain-containing protein [Stappia sp.]MAA97239.1 2,4-dihydroxyhept-2-ene-1,7-dioic acid aldolase [Stappia sp.]MBM19077.1 2,4-dihydroxyhept-2-ene-1,7-dioic acid aldolase [Stappia sp.]|tara:strand:+ start:1110 stop:1403 length:294 start_codon:yes stop_codon:yes gene_type:complete